MTHPSTFDHSAQKANEWLRDIGARLGTENQSTEYAALRATLHAIRDHLSTDEIAHLGAQLPIAVRGLYFEGWNPKTAALRPRNKQEFIAAVEREVSGHQELVDIEETIRVTLSVLSRHISMGQMKQVIQHLPVGIRELWAGSIF
jgi:uncharacterized protein (DUF2267 family)